MDAVAAESYLRAQIEAASPAGRQVMLLDGAIRFGRETGEHWSAERFEDATESLIRCRRIVTELLGAVKSEAGELARRVRSIYYFIFRSLTEAQAGRDTAKLAEALRILEIERDTWREYCEREAANSPVAPAAPESAAPLPFPAASFDSSPATYTGMSFEA